MARQTTKTEAPLKLPELTAIALGGMIGGGIFTVLGLSVATIGAWTPLAIALGGAMAGLAAYSYVKLALYFRDEGATYAFFRRSFPGHDFAAALIGWWVTFGYISTLALYAFTFASYALSGTALNGSDGAARLTAIAVIGLFAAINIWSVKGMGKIEDILVYTKIAILLVVAGVLWGNTETTFPALIGPEPDVPWFGLLTIAAVTFVAYEGFQLVIHAMHEMRDPQRNIPRAIYTAVGIATMVYVVLSVGAILAIPFSEIIAHQEHALAAGAGQVLGRVGEALVIAGALLATMSAISGTLFGASRLMAVIARDGYFPARLASRQKGQPPAPAILAMAGLASLLILGGDLRLLLEFGSITFLLVSILMAYANHRHRAKTNASPIMTVTAMAALSAGAILILMFEATHSPLQLLVVAGLYVILSGAAWLYARH